MIDPYDSAYLTPTKRFRRLSVLLSIHNTPGASQHKLGELTFLSSSMVNNYIKDLKAENLLTVSGKTNRTQKYHLTSDGLSVLTQSLLSYSAEIVRLYGTVKTEISNILNGFYKEGIRSIVLFGVAETAEIVYAAIKQTQLEITGVVDSDVNKQGRVFNGLKIQSPDQLEKIKPDAVVITSFGRQEEIYHQVRRLAGDEIEIKKLSDI